MAMIKCPECGAEVSDRAATCMKCGCPVGGQKTYIRFGKLSFQTLRNKCFVYCNGEEHVCRQGDYVELKLDKPAKIEAKMQGCFGSASTTAEPGKTYTVDVNTFGKVTIRNG